MTFKDSNWLLTTGITPQPQYWQQPQGTWVWWFYGLSPDKAGNHVHKKMSECTGRELLEEFLHHLPFEQADRDQILDGSIVVPAMMPYITSQFLVRKQGDRPEVVPKGSTNLAFIGQFAEVPDDVVFTVEYSVRTAWTAVAEQRPRIDMHGYSTSVRGRAASLFGVAHTALNATAVAIAAPSHSCGVTPSGRPVPSAVRPAINAPMIAFA